MTWEISPLTPMIVRAVPFGLKPKLATREKNGKKKTLLRITVWAEKGKNKIVLTSVY